MCARRKTLVLFLLMASADVSAAVSCSAAVGPVAFGAYDVFNPAPTEATGMVDVTCTDLSSGGGLKIDLAVALSPSATSGMTLTRQMASGGGADRLEYNLYRDAAHTLVWGDQAGLDDYVIKKVHVPNRASVQLPLTIYGRIPAGQDVSAGIYGDRVVLTVSP